MDAVSYTAQWTAAIRALEADQGDGKLFDDELARELAKPDGFSLLEKYHGGGVQEFVAIRTRYVDDAIATTLAETLFRQVVFVAAGMDTRAYRLDWPTETTVFEIDHAPLLNEKRARLSRLGAHPQVSRIEVAADLAGAWSQHLVAAGFNPAVKTLWVAEGLLFFLQDKDVAALLEALADASASGSRLITDLVSEALLRSPMTALFLAKLRGDGTPWQFGTDEPEDFLRDHGWDVKDLKEPGETQAGQRRWPYQVQDRSTKGVPRSWLVQAEVRKI